MIISKPQLTKREFIKQMMRLGLQVSALPVALKALELFGPINFNNTVYAASAELKSRPAEYWVSSPKKNQVTCELCPNRETLKPGRIGRCKLRHNVSGQMITYGAGQPSVMNVDPVMKNPLFHFHPNMEFLALAHSGCNLHCSYCQNWQFSQKSPQNTRNIINFDQIQTVSKMKARNLGGIAFTYTEAVCSPEFVKEFVAYARQFDLVTTLCTAGYINPKPLSDLLEFFDAVTVTYKGPDEHFYNTVTKSSLAPVQKSMELIKKSDKLLEVATLIVPTLNDDDGSLESIAKWIVKNLGPDTPWLLEKFSPQYKLVNLPPTTQATMERAREIGFNAGLSYVYLSNLSPHEGNHTYCLGCGKMVVRRSGLKTLKTELVGNKCRYCNAEIPGVWA